MLVTWWSAGSQHKELGCITGLYLFITAWHDMAAYRDSAFYGKQLADELYILDLLSRAPVLSSAAVEIANHTDYLQHIITTSIKTTTAVNSASLTPLSPSPQMYTQLSRYS